MLSAKPFLENTTILSASKLRASILKTRGLKATCLVLALFLTACQSLKVPEVNTQNLAKNDIHFRISGKIGLRYPDEIGEKQFVSAFYAWGQAGKTFAIDLTGALGIGKTHIESNGTIATLESEKTGLQQASSPEELLYKVTRWQAPISKLPFWIVGKPTPNASKNQYDAQNRLTKSQIDDWRVLLNYKNTKKQPYKLKMQHLNPDGTPSIYKVTLTIQRH